MSFCSFGERYSVLAITPIENLFIDEFMLRAPGDYVKVYLYGLRMCYHPDVDLTPAAMAGALGMEEASVLDAFRYWERLGIVRRIADNPPRVAYLHPIDTMMNKKSDTDTYRYQDFNRAVQQLFASRILHTQDWQRVYDWLEVLGLPAEVVMLLIETTIRERGSKTTVNYIDKIAQDWAQKGIVTLPAAQAHLEENDPKAKSASAVLKQLGIRRSPTVDEVRQYRKWVQEWEFTHEGILYACRAVKIQNPNFNYLESVLSALHAQNAHTAQQIQAAQTERKQETSAVREVLRALGDSSAPTPDMAQLMNQWQNWGFDVETIARAARLTRRAGRRTFSDVERLLEVWRGMGLFDNASVEEYLLKRDAMDAQIGRVLVLCGVTRAVTEGDRRLWADWIAAGFEEGVILVAAEAARVADNPMAYIARMLKNWHVAGISTLEAARMAVAGGQVTASPRTAAASARSSKEVAEHRYEQRNYSRKELDDVFFDIMKDDINVREAKKEDDA